MSRVPNPVLRRMLGAERPTPEFGHVTPPKALGLAVSQAAQQVLSLPMSVRSVDEARVSVAAMGELIPGQTQMQSQAIPSLDHDRSRIVTEDGEQLVTVGSHWPLTGPLPQEMRDKMERTGLCMGCHQNMTDAEVWDAVNSEKFVNNEEHQAVMDEAVHALAEDRKAAQ